MSKTIEERITTLEKRTPVRGPAGDITAAVANATIAANKAVAEAEARIGAKAGAAHAQLVQEAAKFQKVADQLRKDVANLQKYLDERIVNTVDSAVVQVMTDYGVLDKNGNPLNKDHIDAHLREIGVLK